MATRAEIKLRARRRADMEFSTFIGDVELNEYFQASYAELYDLLVSSFEDYFLTELAFTIPIGSFTTDLPANFYKLRGVDLNNGGTYVTLEEFNFANRNDGQRSRRMYGQQSVVYRLMGQNLRFTPTDKATGTYRMWYVPRVTAIAADGTSIGDVLDFEEYIVVDMALKMSGKEETDVTVLMAEKMALKQRIEAMTQNRDAGSPQAIADVTRNDRDEII